LPDQLKIRVLLTPDPLKALAELGPHEDLAPAHTLSPWTIIESFLRHAMQSGGVRWIAKINKPFLRDAATVEFIDYDLAADAELKRVSKLAHKDGRIFFSTEMTADVAERPLKEIGYVTLPPDEAAAYHPSTSV
jgi:hypothetical protein